MLGRRDVDATNLVAALVVGSLGFLASGPEAGILLAVQLGAILVVRSVEPAEHLIVTPRSGGTR